MPPLDKGDCLQIARLHRESITTGFLSTLGQGFLSRLYRAIASHPGSCVMVERAGEGGEILGFISGSLSVRQCYSFVLRRHFLSLGLLLLPRLFSFSRLKRIFETLLYPFTAKPPSPLGRGGQAGDMIPGGEVSGETGGQARDMIPGGEGPELLSMAVSATARGKGLGKQLVARLEEWFMQKGLAGGYKVVTYAQDARSNGFYRSAGFIFHHSFLLHGNEMNEYRKNLSLPPSAGQGGVKEIT